MDWTEKQQCVLCDRGGDLLVCNGDGCPISVHKSCMGCKAYMDDGGNFHCPYCVYKQYMAEISQSREKALSTKKSLSIFLEKELRDINQQEPVVGMANKEKETSSKENLVDVNNHVCDDVQNRCAEKHQQSKTHLPCQETCDIFVSEQTNVNTCRIMVLYNSNSNAPDASGLDCKSYKEGRVKVDQLESDVSKKTKVDYQTGNANQQRDTSTEEEAAQSKNYDIGSSAEKKITLRKRKQSVAFKKSGRSKRQKEGMMENGAETLESLQNGTQLQSKPHSRIDPNGARKGSLETKSINISNPKELKDSSKPQSKPDRKINHNDSDSLLDHPSGARRVSLETKSINISNPKEFKDSFKPQSKPDRKIDHNDSDSLLDHPSGARKGSLETKSTNVSNSEGLKDSSLGRIIKLPLQTGKQRILWTVQEEDMLKEGVQKFSSSERKNLPWKKILDFGRHVFHPYRNPSDLKDKWRKIAK